MVVAGCGTICVVCGRVDLTAAASLFAGVVDSVAVPVGRAHGYRAAAVTGDAG
jgi:hypothetical protein